MERGKKRMKAPWYFAFALPLIPVQLSAGAIIFDNLGPGNAANSTF
jgi:hypothetical protein